VNPWPPLLRLIAAIVGLALGIRLIYELLLPVLPGLIVIAVLASVAYLAWQLRSRRDRW
jgi:hypothetical protein